MIFAISVTCGVYKSNNKKKWIIILHKIIKSNASSLKKDKKELSENARNYLETSRARAHTHLIDVQLEVFLSIIYEMTVTDIQNNGRTKKKSKIAFIYHNLKKNFFCQGVVCKWRPTENGVLGYPQWVLKNLWGILSFLKIISGIYPREQSQTSFFIVDAIIGHNCHETLTWKTIPLKIRNWHLSLYP